MPRLSSGIIGNLRTVWPIPDSKIKAKVICSATLIRFVIFFEVLMNLITQDYSIRKKHIVYFLISLQTVNKAYIRPILKL